MTKIKIKRKKKVFKKSFLSLKTATKAKNDLLVPFKIIQRPIISFKKKRIFKKILSAEISQQK